MNKLVMLTSTLFALSMASPQILAAQDPLTPSWVSELVTGCSGTTSGLSASKIYYVSSSGTSSGSGASFSSPLDFSTALSKVKAGQMILLKPGTYTIDYSKGEKNTLKFSKSGKSGSMIKVVAANCGKATFDFSFPDKKWVQNSFGFYVTGDYWYFKGINITRAGYQGVYVTGKHNTFENCAFYKNRNTGFEINKGGAYTTVINCDAYRNYDPKKLGSMADGFGPKQKQGKGNAFYGCRAWENSDDGFDEYESDVDVVIKDSWSFRNGIDYWNYGNFSGNGNGFKLGGHGSLGNPTIIRSIAFSNPKKGFDQNNNAGGITAYNNVAYKNGTNFGFGNSVKSGQKHDLRNNISLNGSVSISNASSSHNSWQSIGVSSDDFMSLDLSKATIARQENGMIPYSTLFRLKSSSSLIDAGTKTGEAYLGNAPDLGAFEKK